MMIKDYLVLLRIHTAALTQGCLLVGWFLAGGVLLSWETVWWCLFGILFHATGFLHNNLCDLSSDIEDPNKKHHPLVNSSVSLDSAYQMNIILSTFTMVFGLIMTRLEPVPTIILISVIIFGWVYNFVSKKSLTAPIWISLCFGLLVLIPYTTHQNLFGWGYGESVYPLATTENVVIGATLYAIFQIWYQIAVEGYLKDIKHDPVNLIRSLGTRLKGKRLLVTRRTHAFAVISKAPMLGIGLIIFYFNFSAIGYITLITVSYLLMLGHSNLFNRRWDHDNVLKWCAGIEIITYLTLIALLYGVFDLYECLFLAIYPIVWFISMNKFYWGTLIKPRV